MRRDPADVRGRRCRVTASVQQRQRWPVRRLVDPTVNLVGVFDAIQARGPVDTVLDTDGQGPGRAWYLAPCRQPQAARAGLVHTRRSCSVSTRRPDRYVECPLGQGDPEPCSALCPGLPRRRLGTCQWFLFRRPGPDSEGALCRHRVVSDQNRSARGGDEDVVLQLRPLTTPGSFRAGLCDPPRGANDGSFTQQP